MAQTVTPMPTIGDVVVGRDVAGRVLRISSHPESERVVLSIWQEGHCLATVRLAPADIPAVTNALISGLVPPENTESRRTATVSALRPTPMTDVIGGPDEPPSAVSQVPDHLQTVRARVTSAITTHLRRR